MYGMDVAHTLFYTFWFIWIVLAIRPRERWKWWGENVIVIIAVAVAVWSYYSWRLTDLSYGIIFVFLVLHLLAAHYSYEKHPVGNWIRGLFGWKRNHYDRVVHFSYGFFLTIAVCDALRGPFPHPGFGRYFAAFSIVVAFGSLYEIGEFFAAIMLGKRKGASFLGSQGDAGDAQKDMLMQTIGSLLGVWVAISLGF